MFPFTTYTPQKMPCAQDVGDLQAKGGGWKSRGCRCDTRVYSLLSHLRHLSEGQRLLSPGRGTARLKGVFGVCRLFRSCMLSTPGLA